MSIMVTLLTIGNAVPQATDMAEASYECVLEKCRSTDRS